MKIGLSAAAFYGRMETEEQAAALRNFRLDTCEVFLQCPSEYTPEFGQLVRLCLGGLPCDSVHPKGTQFESDLFAPGRRQRRDAQRGFIGVLSAGQALGAKYYVWHGPHSVKSVLSPWQIRDLKERLPELCGIAREYGMELLWENVSWASMHDLDCVRYLRETFPELGYVLDIKQARRMGLEWQDVLAAMGDRLRHVHVLDWQEDGTLCLPGEGTVDFPALFSRLKQMDYRGVVLLEPYEALCRDQARLQRSLDYLARCRDSL